jgi:UDP-N-acetylmuramoyl-tripeptide--D-alanyl-D-alanine ligase
MNRSSQYRISGEFIAESTGGDLIKGPGLDAAAGASIDSRTTRVGQVFFAIRGPRHDGHDHLAEAVRKGAVGLVVERDRVADALAAAAGAPDRVFVVRVDETTAALGRVAAAWIGILVPRTLAVTGSVGKTTTKDLLAAALSVRFETLATRGNLNNLLGLPLSVLSLVPSHEAIVLEMGMNAPGEIEALCRIAPPDIGLVTAVAPVHLEGLGSLDAVARAKSELVVALPPEGIAVLNADDPRVLAMRSVAPGRVLTFGQAADADVRIVAVQVDSLGHPAVELLARGQSVRVTTRLVGAHQAPNVAAALAGALAAEVPLREAAEAMADVAPGRHRMEVVQAGAVRVIDDCYNASPKSVAAALQVLSAIAAPGGRIAVLGDMLELGAATDTSHLAIGRAAFAAGVDTLIAVGKYADRVSVGARDAGLPATRCFQAPDAIAAATLALALVRPGDTVLIKGSRGVGLEHVVGALVDRAKGHGNEAN